MSYAKLAARVRAHLAQQHRYAHTVRVARCADLLAQRHGLDTTQARLAGMLHDLARLYPGPRLIAECEAREMPIDAFERANPIVLHARLGAALARELFEVHDPAVLSAIEKHTTGATRMSPLDRVLYLADGLEPGRDFAERSALWELAKRDLDAAMHGLLLSTAQHLTRQGIPIAPQTIAAMQEVHVSAN